MLTEWSYCLKSNRCYNIFVEQSLLILSQKNTSIEMTVSLCIVSNTQKVSNWHACNKYHLKRNKYCLAFPMNIWVKVFKNRQSKICRRLRPYHFLKTVFHKFYLVHYWITWPIWFNWFISCFYSLGIPPVNIRKLEVFRCFLRV